jgi:SAM-dependent methyltransferase
MLCCCCQSVNQKLRHYGKKRIFLCRNCGLVRLEDFERGDLTERLIRHYQIDDPHSRVAQSKTIFFRSALNYISSKVKEGNRTLLEIGCGFGYFLRSAVERGWKTFGVEISPEAASCANDKHRDITVFRGKLKEAKYSASFFDAITLWDVLFMVDDPYEELKECFRVMRPCGIIGIRVRNVKFQKLAYSILYPFESLLTFIGIKPPYVFHRYCFSVSAIRSLLMRVGFTNIEVSNSKLTSGDPYDYSGSKIAVVNLKNIVYWCSELIFFISGKKVVFGPSLLVWAEKPGPIIDPRSLN